MDVSLLLGLGLVILVAIFIVCSVVVNLLSQNQMLTSARRQRSQDEPALSREETSLLLELGRTWRRDEILPVNLETYNAILMPDRKLIITLARPVQERPLAKTGWLLLELSPAEIAQDPQETALLIHKYLQNPRLMNQQRALHTPQVEQ